MRYFTSYFWPQEQRDAAVRFFLGLQQCMHTKTGLPVAFGVICRQVEASEQNAAGREHAVKSADCREAKNLLCTGTEFIRGCVNWYYDECLSMKGEGNRRDWKQLLSGLDLLLSNATVDLAGFFSMGENVMLFQKGNMNAFLLNERWNTAQIRPLFQSSHTMQTVCVMPEQNTGILVAPEQFCHNISGEELAFCLRQRGIRAKHQAKQRMQELGRVAQEPAILIAFRGE